MQVNTGKWSLFDANTHIITAAWYETLQWIYQAMSLSRAKNFSISPVGINEHGRCSPRIIFAKAGEESRGLVNVKLANTTNRKAAHSQPRVLAFG